MSSKNNVMRATLAVTLVIFISKAGGFLREIIFAAYYGTGAMMDAYNAAYSLYYVPVLLFNSCITSTLIPLYVKEREVHSLKRANRFAGNVTNMFALFAMAASLLMYAAANPLVNLVYGGYDEEKRRLIAELLRIMLPSLMFLTTSIVLSSVLNAQEKYLAAQLTGFPITISLVIAAVFFSQRMGVHALAWGVFFSGILQVLILLPSLRRSFRYHLRFRPKDATFKTMMRLAVPAILSMAVNELNHMVDVSLASGVSEGALSALNFGYKLIIFISGVLLVPLTTVMFSKMSQHAAQGDKKGVLSIVMRCVEGVALVVFPITALSFILSSDVVRLAYNRGEFNAQSVAITANAFAFYVVGIFAYGTRDLLNRTFHSLQDTKTPMRNAVLTMLIHVGLNFVLVGPMGAGGLALSTAISSAIGTGALFLQVRKRFGHTGGRRTLEELIKIGIATVLSAIVCLLMHRLLPAASGTWRVFLRLAAICAPALIVYLGAVLVTRVRQGEMLVNLLVRRLKRI